MRPLGPALLDSAVGLASTGTAESMFVGRGHELARLEGRVVDAVAGNSRMVVVSGEEGVGKTALLRRCALLLAGFRTLSASCDEAARSVPFAMISQLFEQLPVDVRGRYSALTAPRAGLEPRHIGYGLVRALSDPRRPEPIALVVDDVQWADPASLRGLGVALSGLTGQPVLVVLSVRTIADGSSRARPEGDRWTLVDEWRAAFTDRTTRETVHLGGLSRAEIGQLAQQVLRAPLHDGGVAQLYEYTGGNPLRALALLRELQPGDRLRQRPFSSSFVLRRRFTGRLAGLPRSSLELLEAIAVLDMRCRLSLPAQVSGVSDAVSALEPLLEAGLVQWWPAEPSSPVELPDGMCRDAVYSLIRPRRRRELHRVAATLVDRATSWGHRVAAATGVDPVLADELEDEATAFDGRDDRHAATCLLWAADLSDSREAYERRLLTGVLRLLGCADCRHDVELMVPAVHACSPSALRLCVQGELALGDGDVATAQGHLAECVRLTKGLPGFGPIAARAASTAATSFVLRTDASSAVAYAELALAQDGVDSAARETARCCQALGVLATEGPRTAAADLAQVGRAGTGRAEADLLACRALCLLLAGELTAGLSDAVVAAGQTRSGTTYAPLILGQYLLGQWDQAMEAVTGSVLGATPAARGRLLDVVVHTASSIVAAGRGDTATAIQRLGLVTRWQESSATDCVVFSAIAEASIAQAAGGFPAMVVACEPVVRGDRRGASGWVAAWRPLWLPLHVEGLIGSGRLDTAAVELRALSAMAGEHPHLRTAVGWLSGWLAEQRDDMSAARAAYEEVLSTPAGPDDVPMYRARLEHAYGGVLSRSGLRHAAVGSLRRAQRRFAELGAQPFFARCANDLVRAGLRGAAPSTHSLTEREREIVGLVVQGMTNREVAARLFISEKTVEYHLGNVFARLGVRSRRDLRDHPALRLLPEPPNSIRICEQRGTTVRSSAGSIGRGPLLPIPTGDGHV